MNKRHDKSEVLKKGMELFHQKGYHNVGLAEICSTTGMQKGTFYNAFKSKDEFYIQSLVLFGDRQCDFIQKSLEPNNGKAVEQLQDFFLGMIEFGPKINYAGCLINNTMAELGTQNPSINEITNIQFNRFVKYIEPSVKRAQLENDLITSCSSKILAKLIVASCYGVLNQLKASKNVKESAMLMKVLFKNIRVKSI